MLGRLELSIDECIAQYEELGKKVFGKTQFGGKVGQFFKGATNQAFYDRDELQSAIKDVMRSEQIPVASMFCPENPQPAKVMVCVTRVQSQQPDVLRTYKTLAPSEENYDCQVWEAASATAAAPIYFKNVDFEGSGESWCDGALWRNNPINEALAEASRHKDFSGREIGCISVKMMTAAEEIADQFSKSQTGRDLASSKRYFRFSVPQGLQELKLDEWKKTELMKALTTAYLKDTACAEAVTTCAQSLLAPDENLTKPDQVQNYLMAPRRCTHFVARPLYANALRDFFNFGPISRRYVLWGTGGVGKTQVALDYSRTRATRNSVFWIHADSYASFSKGFHQVLKLLVPDFQATDPDSTDKEALMRCCHALQEHGQFLLILDNADNLDEFLGRSSDGLDLREFLPKNGDILLTTRDPRFLGGFVPASHGMRVKPMNDEEAMTLIADSVPSHLATSADRPLILELQEELGNLPLAIAQAAANIRELQISLSQYIKAYRDRRDRMDLMQRSVDVMDVDDSFAKSQSILITWEVSFEHLEARHPDSAYCLNAMCLFHQRRIPALFLSRFPRLGGLSKPKFQMTIGHLLRLSLIEDCSNEHDFTEYSLHPVVHQRIYERLLNKDTDLLKTMLETAFSLMAIAFPVIYSSMRNQHENSSFSTARYLLPHAAHQASLLDDLGAASRSSVRLLQVVSSYLGVLNLTILAVRFIHRAVVMSESVWAEGDIWQIHIRKAYAKSLCQNAEYAEAKRQCLLCLHMLELPNTTKNIKGKALLFERDGVHRVLYPSLDGLKEHEESEVIIRKVIDFATERGMDKDYSRRFRQQLGISIVNQNRLEEAQEIYEVLIREVNDDQEWKSAHMDYYRSLESLKAGIAEKLPMATSQEEQQTVSAEILEARREAFNYDFFHEGMHSLKTWTSANNLLLQFADNIDVTQILHEEAVDVATKVFRAAMESNVTIQGQLLEKFEITMRAILHIRSSIPMQFHGTNNVYRKFIALHELSETFLNAQNINLGGLLSTQPYLIEIFAVDLQARGRFTEAESLHRQALRVSHNMECKFKETEHFTHYYVMLAISQQSERLEDAFQYRRENIQLISKAEAILGDLKTHLSGFRRQHELYEAAKDKLAHGSLRLGDKWYTENADDLGKAQMRWGWLLDESEDRELKQKASILDG